jgi:PilZ domain-containing protein
VTDTTDARSSQRFPIKLPITVRTKDSRELFAETANISAGGVLFYTNVELGEGTEIFFRIVLPAGVVGTETDVLVNCTGRVVRCTEIGGKKCVGAIIDEYVFERVYAHAV